MSNKRDTSWNTLSDEEKVAWARQEVGMPLSPLQFIEHDDSDAESQRFKAHDWEEALDQVVEEKHKLRCALMDILLTWNLNMGLSAVENALQRAKEVLDETDVKLN